MHTDHTSHADPTTVVLLDPTHHDGEAGLDLLTAADTHVALVVLLSGRTSAALREFAAAEGIALAEAGFTYLDQAAERAAGGDRAVETVLATGPDLVTELTYLVAERQVARIVLPPSTLRLDGGAVDRLADAVPSVEVATAGLTAVH